MYLCVGVLFSRTYLFHFTNSKLKRRKIIYRSCQLPSQPPIKIISSLVGGIPTPFIVSCPIKDCDLNHSYFDISRGKLSRGKLSSQNWLVVEPPTPLKKIRGLVRSRNSQLTGTMQKSWQPVTTNQTYLSGFSIRASNTPWNTVFLVPNVKHCPM